MPSVTPASAQELAAALEDAAAHTQTVAVIGNNSKHLMAGPSPAADVVLSTARLNRILQYEPNDLTISVEAGMRWAVLQETLARRRQMIALDPPFYGQATVGGVIASNSSGPMRKNFGTARDLVIGMRFAMLDGKLVPTGGMVVKNVAGLDIGKLLIGSFGTLAAITSVNFRLHALPEETNSFLFSVPDVDTVLRKRDALLQSVLRPLAVDILSPPAAARVGFRGYLLAIRAGGSRRVLDRYARDLSGSEQLRSSEDQALWSQIRDFSAEFLHRQPAGIVLRVSTPLSEVGKLLRLTSGTSLTRAASGVTYIYFSAWQQVPAFWHSITGQGWPAVVEYAPEQVRSRQKLWLTDESKDDGAFAMMKSIKAMFDPHSLLNRSRLYGRI